MAGGFLLFNLVFWGFGVWIGWLGFLALADVPYIAVIGGTRRDLFSEFQYSRSRLSSERERETAAMLGTHRLGGPSLSSSAGGIASCQWQPRSSQLHAHSQSQRSSPSTTPPHSSIHASVASPSSTRATQCLTLPTLRGRGAVPRRQQPCGKE